MLGEGREPAWAPDGTRLAFTGGDGIAVMRDDGSNVTTLSSRRRQNQDCGGSGVDGHVARGRLGSESAAEPAGAQERKRRYRAWSKVSCASRARFSMVRTSDSIRASSARNRSSERSPAKKGSRRVFR